MSNFISGFLYAILISTIITVYFKTEPKIVYRDAEIIKLLKSVKYARNRVLPLCFRKGEEGEQLDIAEYCGAYQTLDLLIHDIEKGNFK